MIPIVFVAAAPVTAGAQEPRAAIEVSWGSAEERDVAAGTIVSRLQATLTERLTQEGFQVVARDAEPDIVVSVSVGVPDCVLRATVPGAGVEPRVERRVLGCEVALADDQLELVQKATELARAAYHPDEAAARAPLDASPPHPTASAVLREVASPPAGPATWEVSIGLDMLVRAARVDPAARAGGRVRLDADWALQVTAGLSRATSGPAAEQSLVITEGTVLAGLGRRIRDGERVRIEGTLLGGALVHHFDDGSDAGTRFDVLMALALTGTMRLSRHLGVQVRLAPGLSRTEYHHVAGNAEIWPGGRLRLDAGLGVLLL